MPLSHNRRHPDFQASLRLISHNSPEHLAPAHWKARLLITASMMTGVLASSVPTPLYPLYQARLELASFTTTFIFFAYVAGVLSALFVGGRIADKLQDKRKLLIPALVLVTLGAVLMATAQDLSMLLLGRLFAGLGTGSLTGVANASLLDLELPQHKQRAALFGTAAFTLGGIMGPILSGIALQLDFFPTVLPFLLIVVLAAASIWGLSRRPLPKIRALPTVAMPSTALPARPLPPATIQRLFLLCCLSLSITWGVGSSLMAMGPSFGEKLLGIHNYALSGYAASVLAACAGASQLLSRRTPSSSAFRYGNIIFSLGLICAAAALTFGIPWLMGVAVVITGLGFGSVFIGAAGIVNHIAPPQRRSSMISMFYIAGYIGNAWPLLLGYISDHGGYMTAAMTLLSVTTISALCCVPLLQRWLPSRR